MNRLRSAAPGLVVCVLVAAGCESGLPVDDAEKALVLRAADLVPFGYELEDTEPYEAFSKTRYFDGSHEVTYEFQTPESEAENALYLSVTLTFERKVSDALVSHGIEKTATTAGLRAAGIKSRELERFYPYGNASTFYILEQDGIPIGNVFSMRDGKKIYLIVLSGMYFDDPGAWADLVEEKLERFSAYEPA
jgi:hypothetical protein